MEPTAQPGTGMPSMSTAKSKGPMIAIGVIVGLLIVGGIVYAVMPKTPKAVIVATVTPTATSSSSAMPSASMTPEATSTPTVVSQSKVYSNAYMSVTIPAGWTYTTTQSGAINIIKGKYILYINPRASQASGVQGGRFSEISRGAPSSDAVNVDPPNGPCGYEPSSEAIAGTKYLRHDLYIDARHAQAYCSVPDNGVTYWYFSWVTTADPSYGYFNYYAKPGQGYVGYVITMSYNSKNIESFPPEGVGATIDQYLEEMSSIVATLKLKEQ